MRPFESARKLTLIAASLVVGSVVAVLAQVPDPQLPDEPSAAVGRERRLVQRLENARQLLKPIDDEATTEAVRLAQALRLAQSILDGNRDDDDAGAEDVFLEETDPAKPQGPARSLRSEARRFIGGTAPEVRQAYEVLFGKTAQVALQVAQAKQNWDVVEEVARKWFHTNAGYDATLALAMRHLDAGEPLAAAQRLEELRNAPAARKTREPQLSLRLAVALRLAGRSDRAQEVLLELKQAFGNRPVERRDNSEALTIFARDEEALSWLDRWAGTPLKPIRSTSELTTEWPLLLGRVGRNGVSAPAIPGEQPIWSHSLIDDGDDDDEEKPAADDTSAESDKVPIKKKPAKNRPREDDGKPPIVQSITTLSRGSSIVQDLIRETTDEHLRTEQPLVPAAQPIVVGDALIVRTLSQVRAFRLSDGKALWHSAAVDSQLSDMLRKSRRSRSSRELSQDLQSLIQQRVWDDSATGALSSDGELIYSLHERGGGLRTPPQFAWRGMSLPQEFNTLTALEVATGRLRWEIGGPHHEQELDGAGVYFLGPPLPWRGELFVLTDDRVDVRLNVLDPRDGRLLWSQALAPSDPIWSSAMRDVGFSPTVVGDCMLCPTGAGTVVAADPVRRELRWQATYRAATRRVPRRGFDFNVPHAAFETGWQNGLLIVSGDRVIVAMPDHSEMLCLQATTGRLLWKQPRGESLYLAGTTDESVIVVGRSEVRALRLSDGEPAWPQATSIAPPLGRGILIEGVLHLPVMSHDGEVISVETRTGRVLARAETSHALGNLIAVNSRLVSQSASQIAVFPALSELQREINQVLTKDANNAKALEQRARMNLHLGHQQRGLDDLRRAVALRPTTESKTLLAELLLDELRSNDSDAEATIRELEALIDDAGQRLVFGRLRAQRLLQRGDSASAAQEFLKLADAWQPEEHLESIGNVLVRPERWIAARLAELYQSLPPTERAVMDAEVQLRWKSANDATGLSPVRRFLKLFGWSNSASTARRVLSERLSSKKHPDELEATLLTLRRDPDSNLQAFATARLAQHWLTMGQIELSRPLIADLAGRFAQVRCLDEKTGLALAKQWQTEFRESLDASWPRGEIDVKSELSDGSLDRRYHIDWISPPDEFHENWHLEQDTSRRFLMARDSVGRIVWRWKLPVDEVSTPLMMGNGAIWRGRWLVVLFGDHFLVIDTLTAPDTPDKTLRPLWRNILFDQRIEPSVTLQPMPRPMPIEGTPTNFMFTDTAGRRLGRAAIIGNDVLCFQNGSRLFAAELTTGNTLWVCDGLPTGCDLSGDEQAVVACVPDDREVLVLNPLDGRLLARRDLSGATKLAQANHRILTWVKVGNGQELRLYDPLTNKNVLSQMFSADAKPCVSLQNTVAVVEPTGRFSLWSLADGQSLLDETIPPIEHLRHVVMLSDRERWLLLTYVEAPVAPGQPHPRVTELYFDQWKIHGPCFAFDRATKKRLWSAVLDWQGLKADQPADLPLLLLAAKLSGLTPSDKRPLQLGPHVTVLDKRSGRVIPLTDEWNPSPYPHYTTDARSAADRKSIEIQVDRKVKVLTFDEAAGKK